jgi:hypothetical protein
MTNKKDTNVDVDIVVHEAKVKAALSCAGSQRGKAWHEAGLFIQRCIQRGDVKSVQQVVSLTRLLDMCRRWIEEGDVPTPQHILQQAALQYKSLRLLQELEQWGSLLREGLALFSFLQGVRAHDCLSPDPETDGSSSAAGKDDGLALLQQQSPVLQQHALAAVCCAVEKLPPDENAFVELCQAGTTTLRVARSPERLAKQILAARLRVKEPCCLAELSAFVSLCGALGKLVPDSTASLVPALCGHAQASALWHAVADSTAKGSRLLQNAIRELFHRQASGKPVACPGTLQVCPAVGLVDQALQLCGCHGATTTTARMRAAWQALLQQLGCGDRLDCTELLRTVTGQVATVGLDAAAPDVCCAASSPPVALLLDLCAAQLRSMRSLPLEEWLLTAKALCVAVTACLPHSAAHSSVLDAAESNAADMLHAILDEIQAWVPTLSQDTHHEQATALAAAVRSLLSQPDMLLCVCIIVRTHVMRLGHLVRAHAACAPRPPPA